MKYSSFLFAAILSVWIMISCKPCDKSKLPEINNMISELDQMQQKLETIQTDSLSKICAKLRKEIDIIAVVCASSASPEVLHDFDLLHTTNKGLGKLARNKGKLLQEITNSKKQLTVLKQDIENCIWSTDSVNYFYQGEAEIFNKIASKTGDILAVFQKDLSIGDTLCPKLRHYIDSIAVINNIDLKK